MSQDYPTDEDLKRLREWDDFKDPEGWFALAKKAGMYWPDDDYWAEDPAGTYHISTGGWSGNEDIISAMSDNFVMWTSTWVSHRRGGHYEFVIEPQRFGRPVSEPEGTRRDPQG
jgi:hypothetical protein